MEAGAKVAYGSLDYKIGTEELSQGNYFHPMILEDIPKESAAYREELFGPVFSLYRFTDDKEAVDLANDSYYGLSASIFTKDAKKARNKAMKLEVGNVFINEAVISDSAIPNGGIKDSGFGRECYLDGMLETANRKSIVINNM